MYIDDMKKLYKGELLSTSQIWYRENLAYVKEYNKTLLKGTPLGRPPIYNTPEEVQIAKIKTHMKYQRSEKGKIRKAIADKKTPITMRWRNLLNGSLLRLNQSKKDFTSNLLKYSDIQLNEHLLSLGYNKDIHDVDHRIPVSWFRDDTPPHIVNHLSNIHPLNKKDNIIKGNRFAHPVEEAYYHEVFPFIKNMYKQRIYYVLQKE